MQGSEQNQSAARVEIRNGVHGRGVFTLEPIARGRLIMPFKGPTLRYEQTTPQTLAVQIAPRLYLGASGGPDDCVNHSCNPNAGLVIRGLDVKLIAIRDITAGEEIFFDYSTTMDEDDFEMSCACGENNCRGTIRDFKHLPAEVRRRYIAMGIVPDYNAKYSE